MVKAEHVNPFIVSVCKVMKDMCMVDLKIGKASKFNGNYPGQNSLIRLGLIGGVTGEVILNIRHSTALAIVSKMIMMPVDSIDELGKSAMSELGNMVAGNAATVFANSNIIIDITTPTYCMGTEYKSAGRDMFSVPFDSEVGPLSIDIFIDE